MASLFPGNLDSFATNKNDASVMVGDHPTHHNDIADAINKIEIELGINPSASYASVAARFASTVIDVKGDFGAIGDLTVDDTAAIQAAYDAASAAGGGIVIIPRGNYKTTATLNFNKTGVYVRGVGIEPRIFGGTMGGFGSRFRWGGGANSGPVIDFGAALSATEVVYGGGISDLIIDGNSSIGANYGLRVRACLCSQFRNLYVRECQQKGLYTYADAALVGITGSNNVYSCSFENIWVYIYTWASADCIDLGGNTTGAGGTTFCSLKHVHVLHRDGAGIKISDADDCTVYNFGASRSSGSGYSLELMGDTASKSGAGSRHNTVYQMQGTGGVKSRSGNIYHARQNAIIGYSLEDDPPEPSVDPGSTLLIVNSNGTISGAKQGYKSSSEIHDDFRAGTQGSAQVGELGWTIVINTGGTVTRPVISGREGVCRIGSGTTINNVTYMTLGAFGGSATGGSHADGYFEETYIAALVETDTDTEARIGIENDGASPPVNGCYFEKLFADNNWFAVCRAGGTQTRTDMGIACDTAYHKFRIRRVSATSVAFSIDANETYPTGAQQKTITTNIPAAMNLADFMSVKTQVATTKRFEIDFFRSAVSGLAR